MSKLAKHIGLILVAQAVCLGVGLWMQHRFVVSSAVSEACDAALLEMDSEVGRLTAAFSAEGNLSSSVGEAGFDSEPMEAAFDGRSGVGKGVLLVDRQWRAQASKVAHRQHYRNAILRDQFDLNVQVIDVVICPAGREHKQTLRTESPGSTQTIWQRDAVGRTRRR